MLVAARVLQGVAGALLMPNTLALLRAAFPPAELKRAVGIWGGSSALAVASGPIVGGLLVEHVSWESIFLLNLPLGLIAALVTWRWVRESKDETHVGTVRPARRRAAVGRAVPADLGRHQGAGPRLGLGLRDRLRRRGDRRAGPVRAPRGAHAGDAALLPLNLFRNRSLSAGVVLVVTGFFALFGVLFFIGLYLQNVHGYNPVQTGVRMLPLTAAFVVSAPLGGLLTEKFGPRVPLCVGMLILAGCFLGLTGLEVDTGYGGQWPFYFLIGLAMGMVIVASTEAIVGNAPVERGGLAGRPAVDRQPARRRARHGRARLGDRLRRRLRARRQPRRCRRHRRRGARRSRARRS